MSKALHGQWSKLLSEEFEQPYMQNLRDFLQQQKKDNVTVYPPSKYIFRAFNETPFEQVKVVIIGQDPYHGEGQAEGLSFSVAPGVTKPPSLLNILKERQNDLGLEISDSGSLLSWAQQGVLLLNSVLTVTKNNAASHQGQGWEQFTDKTISLLNKQRENLVFLLWGSYAIQKGKFIDANRHLIIQSPHPSPLSAHRGFFGSKPFSRANYYLKEHNIEPIDWQIAEVINA